jgi:cytochrome P450
MADSSVSLFDPAVIACPFDAYRALRESAPIVEMVPGVFLVVRHADAVRILKDPDTFSSKSPSNPFAWFGPSPIQDELDSVLAACPEEPTLLDNDPPEQNTIRSLVTKVFTPRQVGLLEPRIRQLVEETAAGWLPRGTVDFASEFAQLLPAAATANALGADTAMRDQLRFWADEIMTRTAGPQEPARQREVARRIAEMNAYFLDLIDTRRREARGDLISLLAGASLPDGSRLTDIQIVNIAKTFLVGGNETTTFVLTSIFHRLAVDEPLADELRAQPGRIPELVEEMLRLESPAQGMPRWPTRDVQIAGVTIPKKSTVFVMFGSANRDDAVFADADQISMRAARGRRGHLAFGFGPHFCLGAHLARAEARITLETLLPRMRRLALGADDHVVRSPNPMLRGFTRLELHFQPD